MGKRGLSGIVTSLIIILLVLVAIGVVWGVVSNLIESNKEEINLGKLTLNLETKDFSATENSAVVTVRRNPGEGDLSGVKFIFETSDGETYSETRDTDLDVLGSQKFEFDLTDEINGGEIVSVKIYPVIKTESGKELYGIEKKFVVRERSGSEVPEPPEEFSVNVFINGDGNLEAEIEDGELVCTNCYKIYNWKKDGESFAEVLLPFEDGAGDGEFTKDYSGEGNDGRIRGAVWKNSDPIKGGYYEFVGEAGGIDWAESSSIHDTFTFEAWAKPSETIILKQLGWNVGLTEGQNLLFFPKHEGENRGAGVSVGTNGVQVFLHGEGYGNSDVQWGYGGTGPAGITSWAHIAIVYNNKMPTLYVNGIEKGEKRTSVLTQTIYAPIDVGGKPLTTTCWGNNDCWFNGLVDEVRVYSEALSVEQIRLNSQKNYNLIAPTEFSSGETWECEVTLVDSSNEEVGTYSGSLLIP